jgi:hypothetical protein
MVPPDISFELRDPIFRPGLWKMGINTARMLMPKAPANFDNLAAGHEYQVWFAGKFRGMQPVTIAQTVDELANDEFGLHTLTLNASHIFTAALWRE